MSSLHRSIRFVVCVSLALVILAYAGLITLGRWQLDEYSEFYKMRASSHYLLDRLVWSARPISEPLYSAYGWAVNHFHQALIVPFLGLLWLILLAAALYTSAQLLSERSERLWPILLLSLGLVALIVTAGDTTEVLYWPAGAVAYIPTLAAMLLLFLQTVDGRLNTSRGRVLAAVCLIVAAGCTEAGAAFVFCYGLIQIVPAAGTFLKRRTAADRKPLLWVGIPFALALVVLVATRLNRFHAREITVDHAVPLGVAGSIVASAKELVFEVIGRNMLASTYHQYPDPHQWLHLGLRLPMEMLLGSHLWMELFLFLAIVLQWSGAARSAKQTVRQILEFCTSLLAAAVLILVVTNLHFGYTCCERHELLRESWWEMILVGVAIAASAWVPDARRRQLARFTIFAPVLLLLSVLSLGFAWPLLRTYQHYGVLRRARIFDSESGFGGENEPLLFSVLPSEGVITEEAIPTGTYRRAGDITAFSMDQYPYYLLRFFNKKVVVIEPIAVPKVPGKNE